MTLPLVVTYTTETNPYRVDNIGAPNYRDENGIPIPPHANGYWFADGSIIANPLASQTPVIL